MEFIYFRLFIISVIFPNQLVIRATVGVWNQQNLYPRFPTAVARLLQYSGLGSNTEMGFLRERRNAVD